MVTYATDYHWFQVQILYQTQQTEAVIFVSLESHCCTTVRLMDTMSSALGSPFSQIPCSYLFRCHVISDLNQKKQ